MRKEYEEQGKETSVFNTTVIDNLVSLEKANMALSELLNQYEWNYEPDARKALEYGTTVNASEICDEIAAFSWKYIADYKKIMWLVGVARDYCYSALENCKRAYLDEE